jgi:hypothetical protein
MPAFQNPAAMVGWITSPITLIVTPSRMFVKASKVDSDARYLTKLMGSSPTSNMSRHPQPQKNSDAPIIILLPTCTALPTSFLQFHISISSSSLLQTVYSICLEESMYFYRSRIFMTLGFIDMTELCTRVNFSQS